MFLIVYTNGIKINLEGFSFLLLGLLLGSHCVPAIYDKRFFPFLPLNREDKFLCPRNLGF